MDEDSYFNVYELPEDSDILKTYKSIEKPPISNPITYNNYDKLYNNSSKNLLLLAFVPNHVLQKITKSFPFLLHKFSNTESDFYKLVNDIGMNTKSMNLSVSSAFSTQNLSAALVINGIKQYYISGNIDGPAGSSRLTITGLYSIFAGKEKRGGLCTVMFKLLLHILNHNNDLNISTIRLLSFGGSNEGLMCYLNSFMKYDTYNLLIPYLDRFYLLNHTRYKELNREQLQNINLSHNMTFTKQELPDINIIPDELLFTQPTKGGATWSLRSHATLDLQKRSSGSHATLDLQKRSSGSRRHKTKKQPKKY